MTSSDREIQEAKMSQTAARAADVEKMKLQMMQVGMHVFCLGYSDVKLEEESLK